MSLVSDRQMLEFVGSPLYVSADDIIRPQFDFAPILLTGEVVHSASVVVFLIPTDSDVSTTIKSGSASVNGTKVTQGFYQFTAGCTYRVAISAIIYTSGGSPTGKTFDRYMTLHCQV